MDEEQVLKIKENIDSVQTRIHQAATRAGRDVSEIDLIAVTKDKSAAVVKVLAENGIKRIGENYLQEADFKISLLDDLDIEWNMIGNIQRGKEKKIVRLFDVIHSVGAKRTARELNRHAEQLEKITPVYLELNISGEDTKQGWMLNNRKDFEKLVSDIEEILGFHALDVQGLMTMTPYSKDPEDSRPYYKQMRDIRDRLLAVLPAAALSGLSMGMSGDFEVAIEEGATAVRIGTALAGSR